MKLLCIFILSLGLIGCSSAGKDDAEKAKKEMAAKAKQKAEEAKKVVNEKIIEKDNTPSCDVRLNRKVVDFGTPKVTSRAFKRLRLRAKNPFTVNNVSDFSRPFGYYNSGDFPGEATYHNYDLCELSIATTDCSVNLEFRPRAVEAYESRLTINYTDSLGESCSLDVPLKGVSTESYLGKDSSLGQPSN